MKFTNDSSRVLHPDASADVIFERGITAVIAIRCSRHVETLPLNAACDDGAECPVCAVNDGTLQAAGLTPVHLQRYKGTCKDCGFSAIGTLQEFEAAKWDGTTSLGQPLTWTCAACLLGLERAAP